MAALSVQKVTLSGVSPTFAAADVAGDSFANSGRVYLHVKNGGASSITVTVNSQTACNQGFDHDVAVTVAAAAESQIGPFPKSRFDDATGKVLVSYSAVTSVTVAAVEVP